MSGSVKRRNFVPVMVWKQVRRKRSVSRTSRPVLGAAGFGREAATETEGEELELEPPAAVEGRVEGTWGVKERVMAWTLVLLDLSFG